MIYGGTDFISISRRQSIPVVKSIGIIENRSLVEEGEPLGIFDRMNYDTFRQLEDNITSLEQLEDNKHDMEALIQEKNRDATSSISTITMEEHNTVSIGALPQRIDLWGRIKSMNCRCR